MYRSSHITTVAEIDGVKASVNKVMRDVRHCSTAQVCGQQQMYVRARSTVPTRARTGCMVRTEYLARASQYRGQEQTYLPQEFSHLICSSFLWAVQTFWQSRMIIKGVVRTFVITGQYTSYAKRHATPNIPPPLPGSTARPTP